MDVRRASATTPGVEKPRDVLGVGVDASDAEIDRAYRLSIVSTHRHGLWRLEARFAELARAYRQLRGAARPVPPAAPAGEAASSPGFESLLRHRRATTAASVRLGNAASATAAPWLLELEREHDARELRAAQERRRRVLVSRIATAVLFVLLTLLLLVVGTDLI